MAIIVFFFAILIGFFVRLARVQPRTAWLAGCIPVPVFLFLATGVAPPQGAGVVYALVCVFGAAGSAAGVFLAGLLVQKKQ